MSQTRVAQYLSFPLLLLMAVATGLTVAGNYYAQPLLPTIAKPFGTSQSAAANIVTTAQLSYGAGLLLLVPIADLRERRSLIASLMLIAAAGLALSAMSSGLPVLLVGTGGTGLCSGFAAVFVRLVAALCSAAR